MHPPRIEVEGITLLSYRDIGRRMVFNFSCLVASLLVGCQGGGTLRWPTMYPQEPAAQRQDAERFDPFPESDIGPSESLRPRDGQVQRSEPRRTREKSVKSQGFFPDSRGDSLRSPTQNPSQYQVVPP